MKRRELENAVTDRLDVLKQVIHSKPVKACVVSLVIGMAIVVFRQVVAPLLVLSAAAFAALWFFAEKDERTMNPSNNEPLNLNRSDLH